MKKKDLTRAFDEAKMPEDVKITRIPMRITMMLLRGFFILLFFLMFWSVPTTNDKYVAPMTTALISMLSGAVGYNLKSLVDKRDPTEE